MAHKAKGNPETFARKYVALNFNGKQAAIAAGYSPKTAESQASRLLSKAKVKALVAKFSAPIIKKEQITVERTLTELARCAYVDPSELFDENKKLRSLSDMSEDVRRAVAGVEVNARGRVTKVKMTDKLRALHILGLCLKMFAEDRSMQDLGVKYIVLDMPRPIRQVGTGAAPLLPGPTNGNGHNGNGNGNGSH